MFGIMLSTKNQKEKDKYCMISYVGSKNKAKQNTDHRYCIKHRLVVARGGGRGWVKWVNGVKRYKLAVIK